MQRVELFCSQNSFRVMWSHFDQQKFFFFSIFYYFDSENRCCSLNHPIRRSTKYILWPLIFLASFHWILLLKTVQWLILIPLFKNNIFLKSSLENNLFSRDLWVIVSHLTWQVVFIHILDMISFNFGIWPTSRIFHCILSVGGWWSG